jgi:hypothetical protein
MRRALLLLLLLLTASPTFAETGAPRGWNIAGSKPSDYEIGTAAVAGASGPQAAYIRARPGASKAEFVTLLQSVVADDYAGRRIRLTARLKAENVEGLQLWMRVDDSRDQVSLYYMDGKAISGSRDWREYEVVVDVPLDGKYLAYGFILMGGRGTAWADSFSLARVARDVPVSALRDFLSQRRISGR